MKNLANSLFNIVLVVFTMLGSYVYANDLELLIYEESRLRSSHSINSVEINPAVLNLEKGTEVMLTFPNRMGEYVVMFDRYEVHQSGNTTWIGHVKGNEEFRIIVTYGDDVAVGMLQTPKGEFRLEKQQLLDMQKFERAPICGISSADELPQSSITFPDEQQNQLPDELPQSSTFPDEQQSRLRRGARSGKIDSNETAYVDLMILYTQDMIEKYGRSETLAILDNLVTISNQAYIDSQVHVSHRLVKSMPVDYQNTTENALDDLNNGIISEQGEIRQQAEVDLVILVKTAFGELNSTDNACGMAQRNGIYSVVNYGDFCGNYTMVHEIGHNFGLMHDHANAKNYPSFTENPVYPYAYGYGKNGIFGTIMSYLSPKVGKFSNPNIECIPNFHCGIAGYADNAKVLNKRRFYMENLIVPTTNEKGKTINVQASDGVYSDKVHIKWDFAPGSAAYEIRRNTINDYSSSKIIGLMGRTGHGTAIFSEVSIDGNSKSQSHLFVSMEILDKLIFDDTNTIDNQLYWYWVVSHYEQQISIDAFSEPSQYEWVSTPNTGYSDRSGSSFSSCYTVTEIPKNQCEALVAFYDNTNGRYWNDASTNNWTKLSNPCLWQGVTCENGHVVELARAHQKLTGTIPDKISALTHLRRLYLDNNNLRGSIPDGLSALTRLEYLYLYNNQLTGNIPDLSALTRLEYVYLSNNQLTGSDSNFWNSLTNLKKLSLSNNNLSGSIPNDLTTLTRLESLYLNNNKLSGNIPDLSGLTHLESLYLNGNNLCGNIPQSLTTLSHLSHINLDKNHLTTSDANVIAFLNSKDVSHWKRSQTQGDCPTTSTSGTPISDSITKGQWHYYTITASSAQTLLKVELTDLSGDVDLYLKKGSQPTKSNKDCKSNEMDTDDERCVVLNNSNGTWYIGVYGNRGGNYTLNTALPSLSHLPTKIYDEPISDSVSESGGFLRYYTITALPSHTSLKIELTGGSSIDLYLKKDKLPSIEDHCETSWTSPKSCTVINKGSGIWNIVVFSSAYEDNNYTLKATLGSNDILPPPDGNLVSGTTYLVPLSEELPHYYTISPSESDRTLHVEITDLSTDLDLVVYYTDLGSECRSTNSFKRSESCKFNNLEKYHGTYDIDVYRGIIKNLPLTSRDTYKLTATLTKASQRALLLLHGLNSAPDTWDEFETKYYSTKGQLGTCPTILVRDGEAYIKEAYNFTQSVDDWGVLCYKLHFGGYDNTPKRPTGIGMVGLEGTTCEKSSCNGDYSTFSQLGKEVEAAISYLIENKHDRGVEIVLLGHSRGGLAARAYLQNKDSAYRENISGLITTGTPHLGSPIGRIWSYLMTKCLIGDAYKKSSEPNGAKRKMSSLPTSCDTDWEVADFVLNNSGLDVRSPSVYYLSNYSSNIRNLNLKSNVSNLPDHIFYKKIFYDGMYLGTLEPRVFEANVIENNAITIGGGAEYRYSIFHLQIPFATQTVSSEAEKFILGEGKKPKDFLGDGIVTKDSQTMNFGKPHEKNIQGTGENILHVQETQQVGDLDKALYQLYRDLKWKQR